MFQACSFRSKFAVVAALASLALASAASVQAGQIYEDSFTRVGNLNGSSPVPVDATSATYTASPAFTTNGTSAVGNSNVEAYLPVTLGSGTYTASVTINPTGGINGDWLAFGFTAANALGTVFYSDSNAQLWLGYRANRDGNVQSVFTFHYGPLQNEYDAGVGTDEAPDRFTISLNGTTGAFSITDSLGLIDQTGMLSLTSLASINGISFRRSPAQRGPFKI